MPRKLGGQGEMRDDFFISHFLCTHLVLSQRYLLVYGKKEGNYKR